MGLAVFGASVHARSLRVDAPRRRSRGGIVRWQRLSARRASGTLSDDPRPIIRRIPTARQEWRPQPGCVPQVVIREPEESWWRAQDDFHEVLPVRATTTVAVLQEQDA